MKKSIYIFGMVCLSISLMGTIFKAAHLPGAAILLTIGLGSLALLFLPFALSLLLKETDDKLLKFVYYAAFISFSIDFIGALFKILHWPGAEWLMVIGLPLPFILFLPAYITYHNKRKLKANMSFFSIILFMIYMGVFSTFLALRADFMVYKGYIISASSLSETNRFLRTELKQSADISSLNSTELLVKQIETLKLKLVMVFEPEIKDLTLPDRSFNYADICAKDKKLAYEDFNNAGLQSINQQLIEFYKLYDNNDKNTLRLMNESDTYRLQRTDNEAPLITYLPIIAVMNVLTDWQNKILLIEYLYNHPQIEL
jgi:hypothetical protein